MKDVENPGILLTGLYTDSLAYRYSPWAPGKEQCGSGRGRDKHGETDLCYFRVRAGEQLILSLC